MKIKETIRRYGKTYVPVTELYPERAIFNGELSPKKFMADELKFIFQRKLMKRNVEPPIYILPTWLLLFSSTMYYSSLFIIKP